MRIGQNLFDAQGRQLAGGLPRAHGRDPLASNDRQVTAYRERTAAPASLLFSLCPNPVATVALVTATS
jgi:hypothetical protein